MHRWCSTHQHHLPAKVDVVEAPDGGGEDEVVPHLASHRHHREPDAPGRGVARSPAFPRAVVRIMPETPQPERSSRVARSFVKFISFIRQRESVSSRAIERKGKERKGKGKREVGRQVVERVVLVVRSISHPAPSANAFETAFATSLRPPPSIAVATAATATRVIMM